jgi:acetamidase/formamidase
MSAKKPQTVHRLAAGPKTVHLGHFSSDLEPALVIDPGDLVVIDTLGGLAPDQLEAAGLAPDLIPESLRDIFREVKERGPGPHILTGPVFIRDAQPGDILEVHLHAVKLTSSYGYSLIRPGKGALPEDFPYDSTRILRIDVDGMTSEVAPGVLVPLRPFFGNLGVAPPPAMGRVSSMPPGIHGGNMDNKELIPGTILYLPVHVKGALFSAGDAHAVQGDGEVSLTGLETAAQGTFQFFLRKKGKMTWPRAETPTHFILMGFDPDLDVAVQMAVREVIDFLGERMNLSREDAYRIASLTSDLRVTQVVDGVKGIHAMLPKAIFSRTE